MDRVLLKLLPREPLMNCWNIRKPDIGYSKAFGCKYFILKNKEELHKFDSKVDEGNFIGYSTTSKAYRMYNKRTLVL